MESNNEMTEWHIRHGIHKTQSSFDYHIIKIERVAVFTIMMGLLIVMSRQALLQGQWKNTYIRNMCEWQCHFIDDEQRLKCKMSCERLEQLQSVQSLKMTATDTSPAWRSYLHFYKLTYRISYMYHTDSTTVPQNTKSLHNQVIQGWQQVIVHTTGGPFTPAVTVSRWRLMPPSSAVHTSHQTLPACSDAGCNLWKNLGMSWSDW